MQNLWAYLPSQCLHFISYYSPGFTLKHARSTEKIATDVARKLVQTKTEELRHGTENRDIMSLLGTCLSFTLEDIIETFAQSRQIARRMREPS